MPQLSNADVATHILCYNSIDCHQLRNEIDACLFLSNINLCNVRAIFSFVISCFAFARVSQSRPIKMILGLAAFWARARFPCFSAPHVDGNDTVRRNLVLWLSQLYCFSVSKNFSGRQIGHAKTRAGNPWMACIIFEFTVNFNYCRGGNERLMIINVNWRIRLTT